MLSNLLNLILLFSLTQVPISTSAAPRLGEVQYKRAHPSRADTINSGRLIHRNAQPSPSPYPSPSPSPPAPAPSATTLPPVVKLFTGNWTSVYSSGKRCEAGWGGWGTTYPNGVMAAWDFPFDGKGYWIETFDYNVFTPKGEYLVTSPAQYDAQNGVGLIPTKALRVSAASGES